MCKVVVLPSKLLCFFEFLFAIASSDRKVPIGVQNNGTTAMLVYQDNPVAGSSNLYFFTFFVPKT